MTCNWCERDINLYKLCEYEDHNVCKSCYDKYIALYPNRLSGCPYCVGVVEVVILSVEDDIVPLNTSIPDEVYVFIASVSFCCLSFMIITWVYVFYILNK
jgi:hypothetical protein